MRSAYYDTPGTCTLGRQFIKHCNREAKRCTFDPVQSPPVKEPKQLGRYEVRAKIGEGGMATLFVGKVRDAGRESSAAPMRSDVVALKVIRDEFSANREFVNMFLDEAKIVSLLRHPNIVELFELGREGQRVFLALELLFGQSLWHVWEACKSRGVRVRYDMIAWIGARVADALHYAHELADETGTSLGIVHRDVNPSNIFVTFDGNIKVIDFGLAKARNRLVKTAAGIIKGKIAYMSPEQAVGSPIDGRSDIFALATTLWELSTDRRLFRMGDDVETLKRIHAAEVPDPTQLIEGYPPGLWRVLRRALARTREDRYPSTQAFAAELDDFARSEGRTLSAAIVGDMMTELFRAERERQNRWFTEVSSREHQVAIPTMKPQAPSDSLPPPPPSTSTAHSLTPAMAKVLQPAATPIAVKPLPIPSQSAEPPEPVNVPGIDRRKKQITIALVVAVFVVVLLVIVGLR